VNVYFYLTEEVLAGIRIAIVVHYNNDSRIPPKLSSLTEIPDLNIIIAHAIYYPTLGYLDSIKAISKETVHLVTKLKLSTDSYNLPVYSNKESFRYLDLEGTNTCKVTTRHDPKLNLLIEITKLIRQRYFSQAIGSTPFNFKKHNGGIVTSHYLELLAHPATSIHVPYVYALLGNWCKEKIIERDFTDILKYLKPRLALPTHWIKYENTHNNTKVKTLYDYCDNQEEKAKLKSSLNYLPMLNSSGIDSFYLPVNNKPLPPSFKKWLKNNGD